MDCSFRRGQFVNIDNKTWVTHLRLQRTCSACEALSKGQDRKREREERLRRACWCSAEADCGDGMRNRSELDLGEIPERANGHPDAAGRDELRLTRRYVETGRSTSIHHLIGGRARGAKRARAWQSPPRRADPAVRCFVSRLRAPGCPAVPQAL